MAKQKEVKMKESIFENREMGYKAVV